MFPCNHPAVQPGSARGNAQGSSDGWPPQVYCPGISVSASSALKSSCQTLTGPPAALAHNPGGLPGAAAGHQQYSTCCSNPPVASNKYKQQAGATSCCCC
jgi:hypothetical protein